MLKGKSLLYFNMIILTALVLGQINCMSMKSDQIIVHPEIPSKFLDIFKIGFNINEELFVQINQLISPGDTVLEFGSGGGTEALTSLYNVYSIEHDPKWVNHVNKSHYIYAPLKEYDIREFPDHKMWYDVDIIKANLPSKYDLILVDGPLGSIGRGGFYQFINLFDTSVPIIFDDVNRSDELKLVKLVSNLLNRPYQIFKHKKSFAVIGKTPKIFTNQNLNSKLKLN